MSKKSLSKVEEQIQALKNRQLTMDYIDYIIDLVKNDQKCVDYLEVQDSVLKDLIPFLEKQKKSFEDGEALQVEAVEREQFTSEEVKILKSIVARATFKSATLLRNDGVLSGKEANSSPAVVETPRVAKPTAELSMAEKMSFSLNNRHLANARVQVINEHNVQISGIVVGLDAPDVVIKTDTGPTIKVPLEKVVMGG